MVKEGEGEGSWKRVNGGLEEGEGDLPSYRNGFNLYFSPSFTKNK